MGMSPHSSSTYMLGWLEQSTFLPPVKRKNGNTNQGNTFGDYTDDKGNIDVNTEDDNNVFRTPPSSSTSSRQQEMPDQL